MIGSRDWWGRSFGLIVACSLMRWADEEGYYAALHRLWLFQTLLMTASVKKLSL